MSDQGIDLGIDFGTTNCTVGRVLPDGRTPVNGPMPSVGAWRNGQVVFGDEARRHLASPEATYFPVRDLKLLLGGNQALRAGRVDLDPVKLSAELVRQLTRRYYPKDRLRSAVIGTPVRMPGEHRKALREATRLAGFESVRFVYEPTAALFASWQGGRTGRDLALVVDWGGGTLDLALVRVENYLYREIIVDGDISDLGGTEIDELLKDRVLEAHPAARAAVERQDGGRDRFKQAVEAEKITLLEGADGEDAEPRLVNSRWLDQEDEILLEASLVYRVHREFAAKARDGIVRMLVHADVRPQDVTHLLFAGGVCKCQPIKEEIGKIFKHAMVLQTANPQMQTGLGCTRLTARPFDVELAADFAARQCDDRLCILMPRGQCVTLGNYRMAEFWVTGIDAQEAHFDLGVCHFDPMKGTLLSADPATFRSLTTMHVALGKAELPGGQQIPDVVKLYTGVESNLTVAVFLESVRGKGQAQASLSGVPLALRIKENAT